MKVNTRIRSVLTLVLSLFVFSQCSLLEQEKNGEDFTEINPSEKNISQGQVVMLQVQGLGLGEEFYTGKFGETELQLGTVDDSTLTFIVPSTLAGPQRLTISSLEIAVNYVIQEVSLSAPVEQVLASVKSSFTEAIALMPEEESASASQAFAVFSQAMESATAAEKREFAIYYETNQEVFTGLMITPEDENTGGRILSSNFVKFKKSVYLIGIGAVSVYSGPAWGAAAPLIVGAGITAMYIGFENAKKHHIAFQAEKLSVMDVFITNAANDRALSSVRFDHDKPKTLSLSLEKRGVSNADRGGNSAIYNLFFEYFDQLAEYTESINRTIDYINSKSFFGRLPKIEAASLPGQSGSQQIPLASANHGNLDVKVLPSGIKIKEKKYSENRLTLTLISETNYPEPVDIKLNFTYTDEYNNVTISKEAKFQTQPNCIVDEKSIVGQWQFQIYSCESGPSSSWQELTFDENYRISGFEGNVWGSHTWSLDCEAGYLYADFGTGFGGTLENNKVMGERGSADCWILRKKQ